MADAYVTARRALRRGGKAGDPIQACDCFCDFPTGSRTGEECQGVCEDAVWYVADAIMEAASEDGRKYLTLLQAASDLVENLRNCSSQNNWKALAAAIEQVEALS